MGRSFKSCLSDMLPKAAAALALLTATLAAQPANTILMERWDNVAGTAVTNLTSNANYPNNPTSRTYPTLYEIPVNAADNYGSRTRGYVKPPTTGSYTFWIACDDACELWLGTSSNPATATMIASTTQWTNSREWTKYASQQSAAISLTANVSYYIETRHKEGTGGDAMAVGWQGPGITGEVERPIPGTRLSPFIIAPAITTQPANQTVTAGATAAFSVVATGGAPLSYQWRKNGTNISGATSASYTTPATVAADNGALFSVVVTNGGGTVTSNNATLTVNTPPSITTQPANATVTAGATATFSVVAAGTAPLSYQWRKGGTNITGATSASYTTPATVSGDNGALFSVVVTNSLGSVTSGNATLTVNSASTAPAITTQPANQTVNAGATATFSVVASGTAPLSYQWRKGGTNISGATSASYTTPAAVAADNGALFSVVVTNSVGSVTSSSGTLTVNAPPTITTQPANQAVNVGQTATFSVAASGGTAATPVFKRMMIYYGWLNSFNSATNAWNNENVAQDLKDYDILVLGDGIESPSHADYANAQIIIPRVKVLNPNIQIFGYVTKAQILSDFQTKAGQWNTLGVTGIFMDQSGYEWGSATSSNTRAAFNARVDYVHGQTTAKTVMANSWNPNNILGTVNDPTYPNSTNNPGLTASTLAATDWFLVESHVVNTDGYTTTAGWNDQASFISRTNTATGLRNQFGVKIASANIVNAGNANAATMARAAEIGALAGGFNAFGVSDASYGASGTGPKYTRIDPTGLGTWPATPTVTVNAQWAEGSSDAYFFRVDFTGHTSQMVSTGTGGTLTYQWRKGGTNITGATSASYTTPATVAGDDGALFSVVVTNTAGSTTSSNATLTVNAAPTITSQPQSTTVNPGQFACFSVAATGTAPLNYQWMRNSVNVSGAISTQYCASAATVADNGTTWAVVVGNAFGSVTSATAIQTVRTPPAITTQPVSQTVNAGQTATFSVVASGTAPLTYQWSKNGTSISGATSASYTTPATVAGDNGAAFAVVVTNAAGNVTSSNATLTVNTAPAITTQPANQTVTAGATATFSVVAAGTAPLSYQWRKGGVNISGATAASYTTPATVAADNGALFSVVVTNSLGNATSSNATLTVNTAPTITTQPANQSVTVGQTATFSVVAAGTAPLSYQWRKGGTNITGATSASYTTPATVSADNGALFSVVVGNSVGNVTSANATLTVTTAATAPTITTQPASQTVVTGQTATFSVVAAGTAPLSYQWSKNGTSIAGATASSYTTPATVAADNGAAFSVVVSNSAGTVTSTNATLNLSLNITWPNGQTVNVGQTATFTVVVSGPGPITYQWQKNGVNLSGATSASYTTPPAVAGDNGSLFSVTVANSAGSNSDPSPAILTVVTAPTINTQPANQTVTSGQTATFSVVASGTPPLSYQWRKGGANISGATSASYTTPATVSADNGALFSVVVTNSAGSVTSSNAVLTVNTATAPAITTQPTDQTVTAGQTATFSVTASGTAPLSYQWLKNGTAISGATSANYTTPATASSDNGTLFSVTITNSAGSVTSSNANLIVNTVVSAPGITTQPVSQTVTVGQTATFSVVASGSAPLNYQWRKNGVTIAGATFASYTTPATAQSDNGSLFSVIVTNSAGSVTSANGVLTVNAALTPPSVTNPPTNQTVSVGQAATFSVVATGGSVAATPVFKRMMVYYGWLNSFNSATNGWNNENVAQDLKDYDILVLGDGIQDPAHGDFANTQTILARVKVLNPNIMLFGYDSKAQTLSVFQTKATQWNTLGVNGIFMDEAGYDYGSSTSSNTRAAFNTRVTYVHGLSTAHTVMANCWNPNNILGTVNDPAYPNATYNPSLSASTLVSSDWFMLESLVANTDAYTTNAGWSDQASFISRSNTAAGLKNQFGLKVATLNIVNAGNANAQTMARASEIGALTAGFNAFGISDSFYGASSSMGPKYARLDPTGLGTWPASPTVTVNGQWAQGSSDAYTFRVDFTGHTSQMVAIGGSLSYQWRKNGTNITGATSSSYTTPVTVAADNGSVFSVVVSNSAGSVTSPNATLTVNTNASGPSITTQPSDQTVTLGQTATFGVSASGTAPLTYQWRKNGVNISGATAANYVTPATTFADNGAIFSCVITNGAGSVTSAGANLNIELLTSKVTANRITATVVITTPQWDIPDYVFDKGYHSRSLSELERYVAEHKHLPEIPNASEIKKSGMDMGEMNVLLLKNLEELTLHVIDLQKEMKSKDRRFERQLDSLRTIVNTRPSGTSH